MKGDEVKVESVDPLGWGIEIKLRIKRTLVIFFYRNYQIYWVTGLLA